MNRYQVPCPIVEGVRVILDFRYDQFTETDIEVLVERIKEVLAREAKWLEAQRKGEVPQRKPKNPCGCGGAGS